MTCTSCVHLDTNSMSEHTGIIPNNWHIVHTLDINNQLCLSDASLIYECNVLAERAPKVRRQA